MAEVLGNQEAAGSFTGKIVVTAVLTGSKEAASGVTGEISDFTGEIDLSSDIAFTGEIDLSSDIDFTGEITNFRSEITIFTGGIGGITKAMVTEASWIDYVIFDEKEQALLAPKQGGRAEPTEDIITKEKVPDSFMEILLQRRPLKKQPPLTDGFSDVLSKYNPKLRELWLIDEARRNCCVDLHYDVLRQHAEQGFAEVGVVFTGGLKQIFVLP